MTDRLTPPQICDLADLMERYERYAGSRGRPLTWSSWLREEVARREAEAKPQNGRGHIPLITCPGSTKSCMGYDCLDKGCLDGEPMASGGVSVPELRNSNISLGGCEVCTTPTACKQEKHCDHYRLPWSDREGPGSAAAPKGWPCVHGGECKTPTFCGTGYSVVCQSPKDKPAPAADDLPTQLRATTEAMASVASGMSMQLWNDHSNAALQAADRIEAQAREIARLEDQFDAFEESEAALLKRAEAAEARVRELERECGQWQEASGQANVRAEQLEDKWEAEKARADKAEARVRELEAELAAERDSRQIAQATCDMQKARADGLAAAIDRAVEELDAIEKAASANDPWDELQVRAADTAKKLRMAAALTEGGA